MKNLITRTIEKVKAAGKKWKRTTAAEKYAAKYIGRIATELRTRQQKQRTARLKLARKLTVRAEKRALGRRLTADEMAAVSERQLPSLASV